MAADAMIFPSGGTFTNTTFGDGCTFVGCTFFASCKFGDGCTFEKCVFIRKPGPFSVVGTGGSFSNCVLDWVNIGMGSRMGLCSFGSVVIGPDCIINVPGNSIGKAVSETYSAALGEQISNGVSAGHDWCSYRCKPGRYILGAEGQDGSFSGIDEGIPF